MKTLNYAPLKTPVTFAERRKTKSGWVILTGLIGGVIMLLIGLVWGQSVGDLGPLLPMSVPAAFLFFFAGSVYLTAAEQVRLHRFADANEFTYAAELPSDGRAGMIFNRGKSREFDDILSAENNSFSEIGNYQYTTGSGRSRRTHHYGYMRLKLPRKLPHMVLDAKKNNFFGGRMSSLGETFSSDQKMSLEGDFDSHFTLYAPAQYKTDALYVFTPDVMQAMIAAVGNYDCEVIDDDFYIYSRRKLSLTSQKQLEEVMAIADTLHPELTAQADYYADARVDDRSLNEIAGEGKRLKSSWGWLTILFVFIVLYFIGRTVASIFGY